MSDFMLLGILRMPFETDDGNVAFTQFRSAARSAADRIEQLAVTIEALTEELSACTESPGGCGYWRERSKALTAERDEALECNEQFFVDNQFLRGRVAKAEAERDEAWAYMSALQGDLYDAIMIKAERDRLRALLSEADRRIVWEANGFGSDFADQVQSALKGKTP